MIKVTRNPNGVPDTIPYGVRIPPSKMQFVVTKIVVVSLAVLFLLAVVALPVTIPLKCLIICSAATLLIGFLAIKILTKRSTIIKELVNEYPKYDEKDPDLIKKPVEVDEATQMQQNKDLAKAIVEGWQKKCLNENNADSYTNGLNYVKSVVECEEFYLNPTHHIMNLIIEEPSDPIKYPNVYFIVRQIPHFIEKLKHIESLRVFANERYEEDSLGKANFEASIASQNRVFWTDYLEAIDAIEKYIYDPVNKGNPEAKEKEWKNALSHCCHILSVFSQADQNLDYISFAEKTAELYREDN